MSRTGAGQAWTHKNSGSKIIFGGVYPTVMAPAGVIHASGELLPPYQSLQQRKVYKKYDAPVVIPNIYAGGFRRSLSSGTIQQGGYWHNDSGLAISWLAGVLYIGGNWGFPASPPSSSHFLAAAAMSSKTEVILLWGKLETGPVRYSYRVQRNRIIGVMGDEILFGSVSSAAVGDFAVGVQLSGLDSTAKKFAALSTSGFSQTVTLYTFADNYLSNTSSVILSRNFSRVSKTVTSTVTGSGMTWHQTSSTTYARVSGSPYIEKIQMEQKALGLLGSGITAVSGTETGDSEGLLYMHGTALYRVDYSLVAEKLEFSGTVTTAATVAGFYEYSSAVVALDKNTAVSPHITSWSSNRRDITVTPFYSAFSAKHGVIFATVEENDTLEVQSGSADLASSTGSVTTSLTQQYDYTNLINSSVLSADSYSQTGTTTGGISVISSQYNAISGLAPELVSDTYEFMAGQAGGDLQAAFGKSVGLAHFRIKDPYSSAAAYYALSVDLKTITNRSFTAGAIAAAGDTYAPQIGVLSI